MTERNGEVAGPNTPLTNKEIAAQALTHLTFISPLDSVPLVDQFKTNNFPAGATVFRQGDPSTSFSVIAEGELTLNVPEQTDRFVLKGGDYYGQSSLIVPKRHKGEGIVTSSEDLTLLSLEGANFREFLRGFQPNDPLIERYRYSDVIKQRTPGEYTPEALEQRRRMMACLDQVRLFKDFDEADKEDVIDLLQEKQLPKGHVLFNPGDPGDRLYLLEKGRVVARIKEGEEFRDVAIFKSGDCFGEMALLSDQPRSARVLVTSEEGATMFFLPKEDFEGFLALNLKMMRRFVGLMSRRLAEEAQEQISPSN